MESILSLPKNCMVFLRIIPVKKVDEVHRIVYNTESAEKIGYCSHEVRPATHLAILNRLWRWGEMHSSQNTHPPCQSAE